MNANDLLERAKFRRRLASLALRRVAAKHPLTPHELKEKLEKVSTLQSIYGAPKDENGKFVGKAGRTIALMKKWLDTKDKFGLPPVGEAFVAFVLREMDSANYIWGQEEAGNDLSRDIRYNFGFDPEEVELVEENEKPKENTIPFQARIKGDEEKKPQEVANPMAANMASLPPMVQPLQGPLNMSASIKGFTAKAQHAYPVSKVEDSTVLPETPVVTRVDYTEDIEKAKAKSEFEKDPKWSANTRNVGKNDLLEDMSSTQLKKEAPSIALDEEKQFKEYKKSDGLYPIRGFVARPKIKQFASFHRTYTFTKTPEGWYGPIKKIEDEGWNWETAIPDTLMPSSIAIELEKMAQGANSVVIDQDEMSAFIDTSSPENIKRFASKKK